MLLFLYALKIESQLGSSVMTVSFVGVFLVIVVEVTGVHSIGSKVQYNKEIMKMISSSAAYL